MLFEDINALFIHIPKTAGLSIEENLLSRYYGRNIKSHHLRLIDTPSSIIQDNFTFSFVRNPWDRLVSFYHFIGLLQEHQFIQNDQMFIHLLLVSKVNIFTLSEVAFVILLLKILS